MQFLAYLTVLMVSISTVLLEVHWLTSPAPQPKPAVQAADVSTQPRKVEGPTVALSPVYPKPPEALPAAPTSAPQSQPQQLQAQQSQTLFNAPAASASNAPAAPAAVTPNAEPQKPAAETTGVAVRTEDTREPATVAAASVQATMSNNRCDVQACSSAYQSFRASDCTYQPYGGARRVCEKAPVQRTARDQAERSERRQVSRDAASPRDSERTVGRRVYDDPDESDTDGDDDSDRISIFRARGPRW